MNNIPTYNTKKLKPRERALARDHIKLHELCDRSDFINYKILRQSGSKPPNKYSIVYNVKSIVAINDKKDPVFGNKHEVTIELPPQYPAADGGMPLCFAQTDVWHPNIRWSGTKKGYICTDMPSLGAWHHLDDLVVKIGEILQYKNYLAENIPPYPEDSNVAQWVREVAEPRGHFSNKQPVDSRELLKPLPGFEPRIEVPKPLAKPKPIVKPIDVKPKINETAKKNGIKIKIKK